jgi:hypothetical protein
MKKLILMVGILLLLVPSSYAASYSPERFGIGVSWAGFQIRHSVFENWLAEAKMQFAPNNTLAGLRMYRYFPKLPRMIFTSQPYIGVEGDWVFSDYLNGGVLSGIFGGIEILPVEHLGLNCDIGVYYTNLWSSLGSISDVGIILNLGATLYF